MKKGGRQVHQAANSKKNSGRKAKRGAISEKPVADLSNELQMVKNSSRQAHRTANSDKTVADRQN